MATPARFPSGLATRKITHPMGAYGLPNPMDWTFHYADFDVYAASNYTITDVGTSTEVLTAGDGGRLLLTTGATTDDGQNIQLVAAPFVLRNNKKAIFSIKLDLGDSATLSTLLAGVSATDTTLIAAGGAASAVSDGIFFFKAKDAATARLEVGTGGTFTNSAALVTFVAATQKELAFVWNGVDTISVYENGVKVFDQTTITNRPTTSIALNLALALKASTNAARTANVDWVFAAFEK